MGSSPNGGDRLYFLRFSALENDCLRLALLEESNGHIHVGQVSTCHFHKLAGFHPPHEMDRSPNMDSTLPFTIARPRADKKRAAPSIPQQLIFWVDSVGGYLACLQSQITIGQAVPGGSAEIAILGDLANEHARIRRNEGYILEPLEALKVDGRSVHSAILLSDGDEIQMGSVHLRFRQPHPLSATARLDLLSRHRTHPLVDGVLLMADNCVLGPNWQNHIVCPNWPEDVIVYRQGDQLYCRVSGELEIDGQTCVSGKSAIHWNSHLTGEHFSMSLEPVAAYS